MTDELLPCPFCGGEATRHTIGEDEPNNAGGDVIVCTCCQVSSHVEFGYKENLVSRWNTRVPAQSQEGGRGAIVSSLVRDAIETGTDEAADYAADRIMAYLLEPKGCPCPGACSATSVQNEVQP